VEFVYLAVILDAFSRRVIGWALEETLEDKLTLAACTCAGVPSASFGIGASLRSQRAVCVEGLHCTFSESVAQIYHAK
jgi:hypothetical protein